MILIRNTMIIFKDKNKAYPVRDNIEIDETIPLHQKCSLSAEEFEKLHQTDQTISIFQVNEYYAKHFLSISNAGNIALAGNFVYLLIFLTGNHLKTSFPVFSLLAGSNLAATLFIKYFVNYYSKDTLFAVYYMTKTRTFKTIYFERGGTKEFELEPKDLEIMQDSVNEFRKIIKEIANKDNAKKTLKPSKAKAIYYDSKNKLQWKTIGSGKWYNTDLFLYLLTQARAQPKDSSQVGKWTE